MPDDLAVQIRLRERMRTSRWLTWLVVLYVAAVLTVDALATLHVRWGTDWSQFDWGPREARQFLQGLGLPKGAFSFLYEGAMRNFDWFKFFTWFLAPFLFALPNMVWSALSFKRWKIHDVMMLLVIAGVGMLIMLFIPFMPEFRDLYLGNVPAAQRSAFLFAQLAWIVSWLPGWEFMHRYVLLDRVSMTWPRYGWFLLPVFEGVYHLQKPGWEAIGMVLFSIFLTRWAMRRGNVLLPFLAHLFIELDLVIFQMFG